MRTVKLVVIGNSGVGKTSLRDQYVSGRFSTGYRATIGADFIAKTVPHHSDPEQSVTLQIWDTAGQERFSSLSSAFFRGADAAVLMFDVNRPATLHALTRWWSEFRAHAPLPDEDMEDYCLVVVGNKTDLARSSEGAAVPEGIALRFIDELVPPSESRSSSPETPKDDLGWIEAPPAATAVAPARTASIDLYALHHKRPSKSRSLFSPAQNGTISSTHTGFTSFHTPWLLPSPTSATRTSPRRPPRSPARGPHRRRPSLTRTERASRARRRHCRRPPPLRSPRRGMRRRGRCSAVRHAGPKLFYTSAKTGAGVSDVFAYVAQRVVMRWEWEEAHAEGD
ncbi:P-loop containing nucleoside triphosphate hydrolase protein [Lactarius deliciosus]|nr:P-loop containing nucleoside triphosphate hydrolase protein [Lactarius deliciosus]